MHLRFAFHVLLLACSAAFVLPSTFAEEDADPVAAEEKRIANRPYPAEFRARVSQAITEGVAWLQKRQRKDGSWDSWNNVQYPMGPTALGFRPRVVLTPSTKFEDTCFGILFLKRATTNFSCRPKRACSAGGFEQMGVSVPPRAVDFGGDVVERHDGAAYVRRFPCGHTRWWRHGLSFSRDQTRRQGRRFAIPAAGAGVRASRDGEQQNPK